MWAKLTPSSSTTYDEVIRSVNAHASMSMDVHVDSYYEDPNGDSLTMRVNFSVNNWMVKYTSTTAEAQGYEGFEVFEPTGITQDNSAVKLTYPQLPFQICFYGIYYDSVWIFDDGFISFDPNPTSSTPQAIPNTNNPNSLIAPFWRDLDPSKGGSITYGTVYNGMETAFVISWNNVPNKVGSATQSFKVIIWSPSLGYPNLIEFVYTSITKDCPTVIGIEDPKGGTGLSYDYNTLTNNSVIAIGSIGEPIYLDRLKIKLSTDTNVEFAIEQSEKWPIQFLDTTTFYAFNSNPLDIFEVTFAFNVMWFFTKNDQRHDLKITAEAIYCQIGSSYDERAHIYTSVSLSMLSPAFAMKTGIDGRFYVPNVVTNGFKIELLFDNAGLVGDQTGGASPYSTITAYPDGYVGGNDITFIAKHALSREGDPNWDYMADLNGDGYVGGDDITRCAKNFGGRGDYITDLSGVTVTFDTGEVETPDANGFVTIPQGATNFNVTRYGNPIGAMIIFW